MAEKIETLINNPELRKTMGKNAQKTVKAKYTLAHSIHGFLEAVKYVAMEKRDLPR